MTWQTAEVTHVTRDDERNISVICPFPSCRQPHTHPAASAGGEVCAGCHAGPSRLRTYRIPALPKNRKNNR